MRRNTRITKIREGGERGGGGLSESRAQSSFATLKSKRHSSLDCRKLLLIKLHSTYSPAAPTKYAFATVYSTHLSSILSREHRQLKQVKTPDSTIRKPIGALRFETRKNVFPKRFLSWGFKTLFVAAGGGYRLSARSDVRSFHRRAANNQLAARISKYIFPCASVRGDGTERTSIS